MKVLEYTLSFTTPAFLGDAEQNGRWRTPPIKALLRQWWRVVHAPNVGFDTGKLRADEAELFGTAAGDGESRQSRVRIRLDRWSRGELTAWPRDPRTDHPEAGRPTGAHLYLGYGPLVPAKGNGGTALKRDKAAIQAGVEARLSIALPGELAGPLCHAIALANLYGTLGGRGRNGWGSFVLKPLADTPSLDVDASRYQRSWREALQLDWPHAIGADERPLVWRTAAFKDWSGVMHRLAELKIGMRTLFPFSSGPAARPQPRHWLSYPVTHHPVQAWGNERLPNSLRFKVRRDSDGRLFGVIYHMPCQPPAKFRPDRETIASVWQRVHAFLDDARQGLTRIA